MENGKWKMRMTNGRWRTTNHEMGTMLGGLGCEMVMRAGYLREGGTADQRGLAVGDYEA